MKQRKLQRKVIPEEESRQNMLYNRALKKPIDSKAFFFEAGQGKNVNGSVFSLIRYIRSRHEYDDHKVFIALRPEKEDELLIKLDNYGINNVELLEFNGDKYREKLATCKYLITDNSFPAYLYKRPEQVYINTWHGTPLKALGKSDLYNASSLGNLQANFAKADYLLYPNSFTKEVMMKDYMMEKVFRNKTLISDYPRNDALHNEDYKAEIREKYNLKSKRVIAYMPTWRGTGRDVRTDQIERERSIISEISSVLSEEEILYVNLHFLLDGMRDSLDLPNVEFFPREYETYDFLSVCDVLITDYSSVSIDFAATGKDIILYLYDYDEYKRDKGFYHDVKDLPFKKAFTIEELQEALHSHKSDYQLSSEFATENSGSASETVINLICKGNDKELNMEDYGIDRDGARAAFFENINRKDSKCKIEELHGESTSPWTIVFLNNLHENTFDTLIKDVRDLDFLKVSGKLYCSNKELRIIYANLKYGIFKKEAKKIYDREFNRQMGQFNFKELEIMQCKSEDYKKVLSMYQ